jgi:hypothetical protein
MSAGLCAYYKNIPVDVLEVAFVGAWKAGNSGGIITEPIEIGGAPTAIVKAIGLGDVSCDPGKRRQALPGN